MAALITPPGILSYPHFFKARPRAKNAEAVYSGSLLFDEKATKHPAFKELMAACEAAAREMFPKGKFGKNIRSPFRNADEKEDMPEGIVTFINPWCKEKPGVVDARREDVLDASDVWAGQLCRFSVAPFAYENSGNRGVSLYLHNVQILKSEGMERIDGRRSAKDTFDDEYADADEEV